MIITQPTREPDVVSDGTSAWFIDVEGTEYIFLHRPVANGNEAVLCDKKANWPSLNSYLSYFTYSIERQSKQ